MVQSGEVGESGSCGGARVASCTQGASSSAHRSAHRTSPFQNVTKRKPARQHFCSVKRCPVSTLNDCFLDRNDIYDDDFHGSESLLHQISTRVHHSLKQWAALEWRRRRHLNGSFWIMTRLGEPRHPPPGPMSYHGRPSLMSLVDKISPL